MLIVAALYRFTRFPDPAALRPGLLARCQENGVMGSLLLAREAGMQISVKVEPEEITFSAVQSAV